MNPEQHAQVDLYEELQQKQARIEELEMLLEEQQLSLNEYRNRAQLLDFVLDGVVSADTKFNIQTWNKAAEEMYGWTEDEVLGRNAVEIFQTEYFDDSTPDQTQQQYREKGIWRGEMIHHHKDGTPIPIRGTSGTIRDEQGDAIGAVTILRDITDEIVAEQALKASEERYRIISELMSDYAYLYDVDENGNWNRVWTTPEAFKRVTGYDREEIQDSYGLYHPDEVERVKAHVAKTSAGENTEGEYRIITKEGEHKWIYISRRVLWDESNQRIIGFYGAGKDITLRKQAEERLIQYNKEKERVGVLQNFIQDASHDLKTPLSTVNTSIYVLRHIATTEKQHEQLDKLELNVKRLSNLIEDMFAMSRLDLINHLDLTYVDLKPYLNDILAVQQSIANNKGIQIQSDIQQKSLFAFINTQSLAQAINNVIENAIRFTPESGQIAIRSYPEDDWNVITIEDSGAGIPPEEIEYIFDRFYRGDKSRNSSSSASTGLGLSIARKIIELHQGTVTVKSQPGHGSCFYICLPRPQ